ncbi:MAG: glycoside hydrolase family 5 protein [Clostridiales bacterium]|jgi:aryl-phospho-beta-D-glucosidase BglC (GH1 family)|nr:glycoside hydrolase family 5 protein [Clostridiales bacterium]
MNVSDGCSKALRTEGAKILNTEGDEIRLLGVNRAGLEFDANDDKIAASVMYAFDVWHCNIVRVPVSQDRWFGFAEEQQDDPGGQKYRAKIDGIIAGAAERGKYITLDLHWNDMNEWGHDIGQHFMPDLNSLLFWKDAAARYKNLAAVLFNVYNEPHDICWNTWKNGGVIGETFATLRAPLETTTRAYYSAGIQSIADTIRKTGANNILIVGGLDWAYSLDGLEGYEIEDHGGSGIIYDSHIYPWKSLDWELHAGKAADRFPVIIGEFGHYGDDAAPREGEQILRAHEWITRLLDWIDKRNLNFTAWDFHPTAGPCLIKNYDNEPTEYFGVYVKDYIIHHIKEC